MKKELLFYNQIEFDSIRELFHTLGYEMISLGFILDDIKNTYSLYQNGVYVIDVKDKQKPIVYRYDSVEFATGVAVYKNYAFIANRIFGVEVIDISDVKNLKQVAVIRCGEAQSCDVVDGVLYAGLWAQHRVDMFDITELNNHKFIQRFIR